MHAVHHQEIISKFKAIEVMSAPLILRVLSASVAAANRAGNIIREVMSTGKLGIVDKVRAQAHGSQALGQIKGLRLC